MRLYCSCGYPIVVSARWEEDAALEIHLSDGKNEDIGQSLLACPQCGQEISLGTLRPRAPHSPHWFAWQDTADDWSADVG